MRRNPPVQDDILSCFLKGLTKKAGITYEVTARPDEEERNQLSYDYECTNKDTGKAIAVEVSTGWRHDEAGKEDVTWNSWIGDVKRYAESSMDGLYHVQSPLSIPKDLSAKEAAVQMVNTIRSTNWKQVGRGRFVTVRIGDIELLVARAGNRPVAIEFSRTRPNEVSRPFTEFLNNLLEHKNQQLGEAKRKGLPTYLVVYNTVWPLFNQAKYKAVADQMDRRFLDNIDHVVIVAGNCPDDCWSYELEL